MPFYTTHVSGTKAYENPFLYRGYYYEEDLTLYRTQTRLYDPYMGRFVSPDLLDVITASPMALTDKNLYIYCDNNPVTRVDPDGEFWHVLIGAVVGGFIGGVSAALSGGDTADVIIGAVSGLLGGALTASGVGVVGQVMGSAALAMASNAATQIKNIAKDTTGTVSFDVGDMLFEGAVSALTACWGQNGASHGNTAGINSSWKQLGKKGIFNSNARQYFYKTAHNSSHEFVLTSLFKSIGKNALGTVMIIGKNHIRRART